MNEIRAFVGHSFLEEDSAIVGRFLNYFVQIAKLHPSFSWEHAESAEPKLLTEKVMSLIENKNTFIGICTKKELVADESSFSSVFFQEEYRKAKKSDLEWKTSDWVIQEIGLAKGRSLEVILLIEEGVRKPGGLQGDVEHITFDRTIPEKSFGKILEMITALSPRPSVAATVSPDTKSSTADVQPPPSIGDDWKTPVPSWRLPDYEHAMFIMIMEDDKDGAELINRAYLETSEAEQGNNRDIWSARNEWLRVRFGKGGNLQRLRELALSHNSNPTILEYLSRALSIYGSFDEAASRLEAAASATSDGAEAARLRRLAAIQHVRAGDKPRAAKIISELRASVIPGTDSELELLYTLRNLAEQEKQDDAVIATLERLVELRPDEIDTRFLLAFKHSEVGNDELALMNYLKIPKKDRGAGVWNNLGVEYDRFRIRAKAVAAYREAAGMGQTLAISNLATKLADVGMIDEAMEKCDEALKIENYHKNVTDLISRLKDMPEAEEKQLNEVIEKARPKREFYRSLGRAIGLTQPSSLLGRWIGPDCGLEMQLADGDLRISGTYEADANPLPVSLGALSFVKMKVRHRIEYVVTLRGHAADGIIKRTKDGETSSAVTGLLGIGDSGSKVLMALSDDLSEFRVMESPYSPSPTFYSIKLA